MSSVGQALGTIGGAIAGFFIGGPTGAYYGAQIGYTAGSVLDPPKGPSTSQTGPRLSDLSVQTSTYGAPIPRVYGTITIVGNVFWLENNQLRETVHKQEQDSGGKGGGGGGGSTVTTYTYSATFAVGLCEGPIAGIRRIWIGTKLIYDAGTEDLETLMASNRAAQGFELYLGTDTQMPNSRIQADKGAANVPAYRGLAYLVFNDLQLADYGNTLLGAQVKVEVVSTATAGSATFTTTASVTAYHFRPYPVYLCDTHAIWSVPCWDTSYPAQANFIVFRQLFSGTNSQQVVRVPATFAPPDVSSDVEGEIYYSREQLFNSGGYFVMPNGMIHIRAGVSVGLSATTNTVLVNRSGDPDQTGTITAPADASCICTDGEYVYVTSPAATYKYDLNLNLLASGPGIGSAGLGDLRARPFDGFLYVLIEASPYQLKRMDISTFTSWETVGSFSVSSPSYYSIEFSIIGDVMLVATCDTASGGTFPLEVQAFPLYPIDEALPTLGEIVSAEMLKSSILVAGDINVAALTSTVRGYRIPGVTQLRAAIEPLQGAFPFDLIQSGYDIKAITRGQATALSMTLDDCIADDHGVRLIESREMDTQLPQRLSIKYLDVDREYDTGEQYAERLTTGAVNVTTLDLALVLTSTEAAQKADVLLYLYWMERTSFMLRLPPTCNALEPADVITITGTGLSYELRLTDVHYTADGMIECQARINKASAYVSSAAGESGTSTGQTITMGGPTFLVMLDLPCITSDLENAACVAAAAGYSTGWPGGVVYRSADNGQTWTALTAFASSCTIGTAVDALASKPTHGIDASSILTVTMVSGELASTTQDAMLNGANHFAYGANGRWEIIAAQNCVLQSDGSYKLSNLLRGRAGTEHNTGTHVDGDYLIYLNDSDLSVVGMETGLIGISRIHRGVTSGNDINDSPDQYFTYNAANLETLSPVYLNGNRHPSTNDWTLTWIRRTRVSGEWRDYVDAPLSEASESYEVDIFSDGTYTTLKRTLTGLTSATASYTSAQQVTDFGGNQSTLYVKVYQLSATVGRGTPLTTSITR